MKSCDQEASQNLNTLHFLVIPLEVPPGIVRDWRRVALNTMGNAYVLGGDLTLENLRQQVVMLSKQEYVFSIRDDDTKETFRWNPATGVQWFRKTDNGAIKNFRMQIKPRDSGSNERWGNVITRLAGNCNWISALPLP